MKKKHKKLVKRYLSLPYTVHLKPTKFKNKIWWVCLFPEIPGIMSDGKTRKKALKSGLMALEEFLEVAVKRTKILEAVNLPDESNQM